MGCWKSQETTVSAHARHLRCAPAALVPIHGMSPKQGGGATSGIAPEAQRLLKSKQAVTRTSDEEVKRIDAECFHWTPYYVAFVCSGLMVRRIRGSIAP